MRVIRRILDGADLHYHGVLCNVGLQQLEEHSTYCIPQYQYNSAKIVLNASLVFV